MTQLIQIDILVAITRRIGRAIQDGSWAALVSIALAPAICFSQVPTANDDPKQETTGEQAPNELQAMMLTAQAFRSATSRIEPSLVSIESFGGVGARQGRIGGIRKQGEGNTTGVIISRDGYILTSTFNFIQNPPVVTVTTRDGKKKIARLLGRDDTRKVCLLKIDNVADMPVPEMVSVKDIRVGQWAISVGVGYGDQSPAVSMGIISAKNRVGGRAIQTDANISPANYGGPLVDIEGRMLGICVPMNPQSQAVAAGVEWYDSGIGFAVPVTDFAEIIERLKDGTRIYPAFVGIQSSPNPQGEGLVVGKVVKGSSAEKSGIEKGDVVIALDGEPVNDMLKWKQLLNRLEAGRKIVLTVLKDDEEQEIGLVLTAPPQPKGGPEIQLEPPKIR